MIKQRFSGRPYALLVVMIFLFVLFASASVFAAEKQIVLAKYPTLKIGFTSQNLSKWLPPTADNLKKVIDFAAQKGFAFIELRDPNAGLSWSDAKEVAAYARQKNIEVIYAMGVGALDPNYFEAFSRGLANAMLFDGPRIVRTGANGVEMNDPQKQYWTAEEFAQIVKNLNKAANTAKTFGYTLYVENANEGLQGDGVTTFGIADLFGPNGVNANVGFQLDMANFFCVSRAANAPADVRAFVDANAKRLGYSHLKSSIAKKPQKVLSGNELAFEVYFNILARSGKVYLAIEHANADTLQEAYDNHQKSIDYLRKNF